MKQIRFVEPHHILTAELMKWRIARDEAERRLLVEPEMAQGISVREIEDRIRVYEEAIHRVISPLLDSEEKEPRQRRTEKGR